MIQKKTPPGELVHYGVKGMTWGVRKARTGQLDDHATRLEKVAAGKGKLGDKHYALTRTSAVGAARRGLKKQSAIEAQKARSEIERLATGKAKISDVLRAYGSANVTDVIRSRRDDNSFGDKVDKQAAKKGVSRQQAEKSIKRKQTAIALAITGGYVAARVLTELGGPAASQKIGQRAQTNRDRATVAGTRGLPRQASSGPNYVKQNRKGTFNITNM